MFHFECTRVVFFPAVVVVAGARTLNRNANAIRFDVVILCRAVVRLRRTRRRCSAHISLNRPWPDRCRARILYSIRMGDEKLK